MDLKQKLETLKDRLTNVSGPALIVFSMLCIGAAGLMNQAQQRPGASQDAGELIASRDCMESGFETAAGRVGCLVPVVLPLMDGQVDDTWFE